MSDQTIEQRLDEILGDITFHPSDIDMDNERREYATKAITQTMLDALPEKKRKMTYIEACKDVKLYELATENHGYNQAISEMESAIKKMGEK